MDELRLIALDADDLAVLSTQLQDAVVRIEDLAYDPQSKRFAALMNRFNWMDAVKKNGMVKPYERRRCGFRIERVTSARTLNIDQFDKDKVLSLLAVCFATETAPSGRITLQFSGGAAIELQVECIEVELRDLGAAWTTPFRPVHTDAPKTQK